MWVAKWENSDGGRGWLGWMGPKCGVAGDLVKMAVGVVVVWGGGGGLMIYFEERFAGSIILGQVPDAATGQAEMKDIL